MFRHLVLLPKRVSVPYFVCAVKDETEHRCRPLTIIHGISVLCRVNILRLSSRYPSVLDCAGHRIVAMVASNSNAKKWPGKGKKKEKKPGATESMTISGFIQSSLPLTIKRVPSNQTQRQDQMPSFHEDQHAKRKEGGGGLSLAVSCSFYFSLCFSLFPTVFLSGKYIRYVP